MSSKRSRKVPKYRHYKPKDLAVVRIEGHDHYLGKHDSPESHERYDRLIAEWLLTRHGSATTRQSAVCNQPVRPLTVNDLILAFWSHVQTRYVKNGKPTSEQRSFQTALGPVRTLYGREPIQRFGPLALVACRKSLIDAGICRKRINSHVTRIRQMFKWGVSQEIVPETVWRALCAVQGLKYGEAVETKPVKPAPEEHIAAIEPFVTPQIWAMVNLQLWTGCRPGEACAIRGIDITMQGRVWEYHPHSHKTEHHEKKRVIYLGPNAQEVIKPWLKRNLEEYLFSPKESREWHLAQRALNRKTPMTPSQRRRKRKKNPKRVPGEYFTTSAYGHAVRQACLRAGVEPWAPNQLRHNAGTRIRSEFGVEAARIILGHASAVTTEIYAEADREKARAIMAKLG